MTHSVSPRQVKILLNGGLINEFKQNLNLKEDLGLEASVSER